MVIQTTANSMKTELLCEGIRTVILVGSPCKIGTFTVDRVYMGLVDIQATKDILSLSNEQFYVSGEWRTGHDLDFVQKTKSEIFSF